MKNKYFIVNKNQEIIDVNNYLKLNIEDSEFNVFIKREAGISQLVSNNKQPMYLDYAQKYGFKWEPNAGLGFISYDYKANLIVNLLKLYAKSLVQEIGFPIYEVRGANAFDLSYPVVDSYAKLYGDRLLHMKAGNKSLLMSYDASYPQFNLASQYQLSSKHLPFGHFSISDCYRQEQSGELMLLYRNRRFFMPDLHPYFKDIEEAFEWFPAIEEKILRAEKDLNRGFQIVIEVSSIENWKKYQSEIFRISKRLNRDILIVILMDNKDRYWIFNMDFKIIDSLGQSREIACIQIDVENAKRLNINYVDAKGESHYPIIIHSAIPGGIERYIYMAMDNFENSFPIWLKPVQMRLIPVSGKHISFCKKIMNENVGIRIEIDDRSEGVSKRIKRSHEDLVPYSIVIGEKEEHGNSKEFENVLHKIRNAIVDKPFLPISWPKEVSKQML